MGFIQVIRLPVYQGQVVIMLQHMQRNICMMRCILIHQRKKQCPCINKEAKEADKILGQIGTFQVDAVMFQMLLFKDRPVH